MPLTLPLLSQACHPLTPDPLPAPSSKVCMSPNCTAAVTRVPSFFPIWSHTQLINSGDWTSDSAASTITLGQWNWYFSSTFRSLILAFFWQVWLAYLWLFLSYCLKECPFSSSGLLKPNSYRTHSQASNSSFQPPLMSLPQMPWKTNSLPFFILYSLFCAFSPFLLSFSLSSSLKELQEFLALQNTFLGDMYVIKVCNIWNLDMFKIIMVMLIVIIRASSYYVFYIRGTVLWTLYTSANLILTSPWNK